MADEKTVLQYKGRPLMRKDNMIYYGSMADSHIVMLQILETKKVQDTDIATRECGASAHRPQRESKGPHCEEERKRRLLHRARSGKRMADARAFRKKISSVPRIPTEEAAHNMGATSFSFFHSSLLRQISAAVFFCPRA